MSRYKLRFVPQGTIPQDLDLGVRMQPKDEPAGPAGCCDSCDGWAVTVNAITSTGDVNFFTDGPVTFTVELLGDLCGADCIEWELRKLSFESADAAVADFVVTPNGCKGATVEGAGSESYVGLWLGLYPSLDGKPFCEPIIFRQFSNCTAEISGCFTTQFGTTFGGAGQHETFPGSATCVNLEIDLTPSTLCPTDVLTWAIVQTAGTTGNGEVLSPVDPVAGPWILTFLSFVDLTGAVFEATPTLNGTPHPECMVTFSHDGADPC